MVQLESNKITLSDNKGTYALVLRIKINTSMTVGKLGNFLFREGYYIYVGSAQGPGGLKGRLKHHCNPSNKPHWHIDYLKSSTDLEEFWIQESTVNNEHRWASYLRAEQDNRSLIRGFGSSDCSCVTHLFYYSHKPDKNKIGHFAGSKIESIRIINKRKHEKSQG